MRLRYLAAAALFVAGAAEARNDPSPPPSGIVVHLFGPGSVMSNVLPTGPSTAPATANGTVAAPAADGATATAASQPYVEPGWHDVLHQMFVVGDPNQKPGAALSTGRANDHP